MEEPKLIYAENVAVELGVAVRTIDLWYRWKRKNPNHPLAELLPEYTFVDGRRVWNEADVDNMRVFKDSKPTGRGGILGELTYKKKEK